MSEESFMSKEINAFYEIDFDQYTRHLNNNIKLEIEGKSKEYILQVDETEFKQYLYNEFALEKLKILDETEKVIPNTRKDFERNPRTGRSFERDVYTFVIKYLFTGTPDLFHYKPNPVTMTTNTIYVDNIQKTVSYNFSMTNRDSDTFKKMKNEGYHNSFVNLNNVNNGVKKWNDNLLNIISAQFDIIKQKYKDENDFFAEINATIDADTKTLFSVPTIEKIVIPLPEVENKKKYNCYPAMSKEMYEDVLKTIYTAGTGMERKPSLYIGKDEEELRDLFLFHLELRYKSVTATGETFNRNGKTDILLKYSEDGSNLFVAECKFWHGPKEFHKAIKQLFENYLTWRDSKTALMFFLKNKGFSEVLTKIKEEIKTNPLYIREGNNHGESSCSYILSLPQDSEKEIYLEMMLFHFDK